LFDLKYYTPRGFLIGSDEVGRGCLAGPVVCCSSILSPDTDISLHLKRLLDFGINDSKKMSAKKRERICFDLFQDNAAKLFNSAIVSSKLNRSYHIESALGFKCCISVISASFVDKHNILNASLHGMRVSGERLINEAILSKGSWLVDGNRVWKKREGQSYNLYPIISGDAKSSLIGLSSIVAKVFRDNLMIKLSNSLPSYGFEYNFGYPTKNHRLALKEFGPSSQHRKSFRGVTFP
tara:strand:- start:4201 stop:4911 length:711 start_codon:yes stop_codon:yes gene_type:complete